MITDATARVDGHDSEHGLGVQHQDVREVYARQHFTARIPEIDLRTDARTTAYSSYSKSLIYTQFSLSPSVKKGVAYASPNSSVQQVSVRMCTTGLCRIHMRPGSQERAQKMTHSPIALPLTIESLTSRKKRCRLWARGVTMRDPFHE